MESIKNLREIVERIRLEDGILTGASYHKHGLMDYIKQCYEEGATQQEIESCFIGLAVNWSDLEDDSVRE